MDAGSNTIGQATNLKICTRKTKRNTQNNHQKRVENSQNKNKHETTIKSVSKPPKSLQNGPNRKHKNHNQNQTGTCAVTCTHVWSFHCEGGVNSEANTARVHSWTAYIRTKRSIATCAEGVKWLHAFVNLLATYLTLSNALRTEMHACVKRLARWMRLWGMLKMHAGLRYTLGCLIPANLLLFYQRLQFHWQSDLLS